VADYRFDHARHQAAAALKPEHNADFMRLVKDLRYGPTFQFLVAEYNDLTYRDFLIRQIDTVLAAEGLRSARLPLSPQSHPDFAAVELELVALKANHQAVHVIDNDDWFDAARWEAFNIRREAIAHGIPVRLILWLTAQPISRLAQAAPDLWAWRAGVFCFAVAYEPVLAAPPVPRSGPVDARSLAERSKRIAELRAYLHSEPPPAEDIRLPLLDELADLHYRMGDLDEALRIRREEEIPVYERLGDVRSRAITQGQIADILQARGDLDEALRIRREEEIPVYERLGDVRSRAITQGQIADILQARGDLDEALRIRREEQLPVFERLGDVRSLLVGRANLALLELARTPPERGEAQHLLCQALADARRLRLPEEEQIVAILRSNGLECANVPGHERA
jgi:tetratricopeptide (TPR) repeat protein